MTFRYTNHCASGSNTASICGLKCEFRSGQNLRNDVDEIFGDPHLSGCMLPGWSTSRWWAKQRRRNYDVTIARHRTLCSHAWRITGGSRHASTPQYLDKTDSADRRRYSCNVIKTLQRQTPPAARLQRLFPRRLFADTPGTGVGRLHATRHS